MTFRLFSISTMYPGYLKSFYKKRPGIEEMSYEDHLNLLLDDSTEFVSSYIKSFKKLGVESTCFIANDTYLIKKWIKERPAGNADRRDIMFELILYFKPDVLWIENLAFVDSEWLHHIRNSVKSIRLITY